ncbi:NrdH-redoxin [Candidatus Uhrbacteria bacterium CG10_big_fil_rev_8_21_14_0_10_48_16]|uniref:NrdH-redoxin n=1 Tax=Candidatus Uhrbacteria bacterium CG10_big_fil_rev_8_21_14_0_10_48_16 TaxID=1975038 RepID=A0A2M8LI87_9BACT|nr:MAG: NrdH-redoxin [Candidatus Uhrbacteria bacterium CG10_big_fil_rev_8_21_14_0_10_48_16]
MSVIVYSTPTCPFCKKVKSYLQEHQIEFTDIDVMGDQEQAAEMIKKSGQMGVPVIDVDGEIVIGFDEKKLKELIQPKS